jgi:hypothetical protein
MRRSDKDGGVTVLGLLLSRLEFADDAALIDDESIDKASERISSIAKGSRELADMEVSVDKTETMFPRDGVCMRVGSDIRRVRYRWPNYY